MGCSPGFVAIYSLLKFVAYGGPNERISEGNVAVFRIITIIGIIRIIRIIAIMRIICIICLMLIICTLAIIRNNRATMHELVL